MGKRDSGDENIWSIVVNMKPSHILCLWAFELLLYVRNNWNNINNQNRTRNKKNNKILLPLLIHFSIQKQQKKTVCVYKFGWMSMILWFMIIRKFNFLFLLKQYNVAYPLQRKKKKKIRSTTLYVSCIQFDFLRYNQFYLHKFFINDFHLFSSLFVSLFPFFWYL